MYIVVVQVTENTASTNLLVIVLAFIVTFQTPDIHGLLYTILAYYVFFLLLNFTTSVVISRVFTYVCSVCVS